MPDSKNVEFDKTATIKSDTSSEDQDDSKAATKGYVYDPEEKGETWDIYKEKAIMENTSKRKSEDAVLIKAKADALARQAQAAEAAAEATSGLANVSTDGRKARGRTAVVASSPVESCQTEGGGIHGKDEEEDENESDDEEDTKAFGEPEASDSQAAGYTPDAQPPAAPETVDKSAPGRASILQRVTYSLAELQKGCPEGVSPATKEDHLTDIDFHSAFKMTRAEFSELPQWRQQDRKKALKIF
jgi:hypothetical protein